MPALIPARLHTSYRTTNDVVPKPTKRKTPENEEKYPQVVPHPSFTPLLSTTPTQLAQGDLLHQICSLLLCGALTPRRPLLYQRDQLCMLGSSSLPTRRRRRHLRPLVLRRRRGHLLRHFTLVAAAQHRRLRLHPCLGGVGGRPRRPELLAVDRGRQRRQRERVVGREGKLPALGLGGWVNKVPACVSN
jgi:hypothetical protein